MSSESGNLGTVAESHPVAALVDEGWLPNDRYEEFQSAVRSEVGEAVDIEKLEVAEYDSDGHAHAAEEVANAVRFLASPASDCVKGRELRVDGGQVPIDSWRLDSR
ncbi:MULTISPECIES: hypothetical protein [Haloarcula]|uniref:hypothetical protein n=1 Tax=Haloarcula TaxID=2237 RepID=UPI0023EB2723|nr:hypothetical protein [Halomicroarcula sp. XH51]